MNSLATFTQRKAPWRRSLLGLFVLAWLNLALQPCVLAMGVDNDRDCPRCPPSYTQVGAGHDMASSGLADSGLPCVTLAAECELLDDYNVDGRSVQLKVKDTSSDVSDTLLPSELFPLLARSQFTASAPSDTRPPDTSVALNIIYCVYLI